jgi:O-glycosyl hydrolase
MHDHNFDAVNRVIWSLENCEGLESACDGVAFHYYSGTVEQTAELTEKFPRLELHYTEGGPRLTDHYDTDFCKWGLMAAKTLGAGYRSFTGWNLMLDELGGPSIGPFIGICGGLVTRNSLSGELDFSGQYKAFMHLSPYVKKSSKIHPLILGESFNTNIFAYPDDKTSPEGVLIDNGDDGAVAVIVNPTCCNIQAQLEYQDKLYYLELYSDSVSTVFLG